MVEKIIKKYTMPGIGKLEILEQESQFNCFLQDMFGRSELIFAECDTSDEAQIASEGYIKGRFPSELKSLKCIAFGKGWIKKYQTYPTKEEGKN